MRGWEPLQEGKGGNLGCAIVLPPGASAEQQKIESDDLLVTPASASAPTTYYVGTAWDRDGRVADSAAFGREVQSLTSRLAAPVKISLAVLSSKIAATRPPNLALIGRPCGSLSDSEILDLLESRNQHLHH